jgi:LytS/YehU family sensor histidine kinase
MLFAAVTPLLGLRLRPTILDTFRFVLPIDLHLDVALYWAIIGVQHAFTLHQSANARETQAARLELRTSELERQLVQSRLGALRMQLHPHFLFNTLNAITILVRQSRLHEADEMLTNLSELLRYTLQEWENQQIPLRNEIEFLRLYLDIERVRFQDRLSVDVALEPDTLEALVPTFLLQPLVENAIRHGVARRAAGGNVTVRSRRMDAMLELQVGDDGPGLGTTHGESGTGLGLTNTRARLRQLYGSQHSLRLESRSPGTLVTIQIPYQLEIDHLP